MSQKNSKISVFVLSRSRAASFIKLSINWRTGGLPSSIAYRIMTPTLRTLSLLATISLMLSSVYFAVLWSNAGQEIVSSYKRKSSLGTKNVPIAIYNDTALRQSKGPKCLSQGLPQYPPEDSIERRMPYAILMGSMKSGTSALSSYLYQHPHVVKLSVKEFHYFDFRYHRLGRPNHDEIGRRDVREHMRQEFDSVLSEDAKRMLQDNPKAITIDDSPRYILLFHTIPSRILCACPWAKMLALLRNPVDRAYSHYNMVLLLENRQDCPSFEKWVADDLVALKESGVIHSNNQDFDYQSEAWKKYIKMGADWPVGRGLYAIQLRQWFHAYQEFGKSRDDFMVVHSESMRANKNEVYQKVLEFLGLEQFDLKTEEEVYALPYQAPMKNVTRALLEEFYKPYNQDLYKLLGKEWDGVWDP